MDPAGGNTYAHGYFNFECFGWDYNNSNGGLNIGGNGYWTLIHELGHALGLGPSPRRRRRLTHFPGVTLTFHTGYNGLNQGMWTVMSYIATDGPTRPTPTRPETRYGMRMGNALPTTATTRGRWHSISLRSKICTAPTQIFMAAATPTICPIQFARDLFHLPLGYRRQRQHRLQWALEREISLVAATLDNSSTGGGVISSANGIHGGYTIANGVVIENAYGGSGNDILTGNSADNILNGGVGTDTMTGGGGSDRYYVDNVGDVVNENGGGTDTVPYATPTY